MKISIARKNQMKSKMISSSSSYVARRRLMKIRVKQAVIKAALKKKKNQQHLETRDDRNDHEIAQQQCVEGGGLVPSSFGFFMNGEFVQLTRGFLVHSSGLPYYLPVVDNLGCLLGDFRHMDDLSLVQDESPVVDTTFPFYGVRA